MINIQITDFLLLLIQYLPSLKCCFRLNGACVKAISFYRHTEMLTASQFFLSNYFNVT